MLRLLGRGLGRRPPFALHSSPFEGHGSARLAASGSGAGDERGAGRGYIDQRFDRRISETDVERHTRLLQERSRVTFAEDAKRLPPTAAQGETAMFRTRWQSPSSVPYRFRIQEKPRMSKKEADERAAALEAGKSAPKLNQPQAPYTDYTGMRFPTFETAENFNYHKDKGLYQIIERAFPIRVPGYRRLDPYLREYIHFLHDLDPARFTIDRIAERYRLRASVVRRVVQEWGRNRFLTRSGLTKLGSRQTTKEAVILKKKEEAYGRWVGYDQLGDQDDPETDDEALGQYKGWRSTNDWVRRQNVEVEMMSAFPMMEKRDAMPKRVDVDMVVENSNRHKIINWIDPTDKVVF